MTSDQLRQALRELTGDRDASFGLTNMAEAASCLTVQRAMLIPDEPDHLIKLTDGHSIYIIEAERIAWIRIALKKVH